MSTIDCTNGSCPYNYYCKGTNPGKCIHNPLFPLEGYSIAIYVLIPFCSALVNTTGNSFGMFKVIMIMIGLNYSASDSTVVAYGLTAGTALYNFISLIFRRHPSNNTSLIDYNIVMIVIPNVLFGSSIGAIVNDLLPPVANNILLTLLLGFLTIKFFLKLRDLMKEDEEKELK